MTLAKPNTNGQDFAPAMTLRATGIAYVVIFVVVALAYGNTLDVPFLFDDERKGMSR